MQVGDSYNPRNLFRGIFIPEAVAKMPRENLSPGAKMAFGWLCWHIDDSGDCEPSANALAKDLGVSERQAREYLMQLEREGFIRQVRRGPDTNSFEFCWHDTLESCIRKDRKKTSDQRPEGNPGKTGSKLPVSLRDKEVLELRTEETPVVPFSEPIDFETFSRLWNRHRGFKKPTKPVREHAAVVWGRVDITEGDLTAALDGYYASDWGREQGYPMAAFVKAPHSWIPRDYVSVEPQRAPAPDSATGSAKLDTGAVQSVSRDFMAEWNVTHGVIPAEYNRSKHVLLEIAANNPEFVRAFPQICEVGRKMVSARGEDSASYADLYWMCSTKAGETRPNWWRLLFGNLRHMGAAEEKSKSRQAATGADALHAMAAKWEGAKN